MLSNGDLDGDTYLAIWDPQMTEYLGPDDCEEPEEPENVAGKKSNLGKPEGERNNIQEFLKWYFL